MSFCTVCCGIITQWIQLCNHSTFIGLWCDKSMSNCAEVCSHREHADAGRHGKSTSVGKSLAHKLCDPLLKSFFAFICILPFISNQKGAAFCFDEPQRCEFKSGSSSTTKAIVISVKYGELEAKAWLYCCSPPPAASFAEWWRGSTTWAAFLLFMPLRRS